MKRFLIIACMISGIPIITHAVVIRVPEDRPTIREAINAAINGDTVLVADGIYHDNGYSIRDKSITLMSVNGPENCVLEGQGNLTGLELSKSSGHPNIECLLQGFTLRYWSRAIEVSDYVTLSISNCVIEENHTVYQDDSGGVCFGSNASGDLTNCLIRENSAVSNGGGICSRSPLSVLNCRFYNNISETGNGGGIYIDGTVGSLIADCEFTGNQAHGQGGAVFCSQEGCIEQCTFRNNTAELGGAVYCYGSVVIGGQQNTGNVFEGNRAGAGADLFLGIGSTIATYNSFAGYPQSDYYVYSEDEVDLSYSQALMIPIEQDVFISPSGSNENDGLSSDTPFRTIQYALSRVLGSESKPITIYLDAGVYSPSSTGEQFCLPALDNVSIRGNSPDHVILDAEKTGRLFLFYHDDGIELSGLKMTGGYGYSGSAINGYSSSLQIKNCIITGNESSSDDGGGIHFSSSDSLLTMTDCILSDNTCGMSGGGAYFTDFSPLLIDCVISGNIAEKDGGGVYCYTRADLRNCVINENTASGGGGVFGDQNMQNCLIFNNYAEEGAGVIATAGILVNCNIINNVSENEAGVYLRTFSSEMKIINTIIRNNIPDNLKIVTNFHPDIRFSNIQGGYSGTGNIDTDPLFMGDNDYRLMSNSPCIDAGTDQYAPVTDFDGNMRPDGGETDIGAFESPGWPLTLRTYIRMPDFMFHPGEKCSCDVCVWNPDSGEMTHCYLIVILDIHGQVFFAPDFNSTPDYVIDRISAGFSCFQIIPEFTWPSRVGAALGIIWYAAVFNQDLTGLIGTFDSYEFGWDR